MRARTKRGHFLVPPLFQSTLFGAKDHRSSVRSRDRNHGHGRGEEWEAGSDGGTDHCAAKVIAPDPWTPKTDESRRTKFAEEIPFRVGQRARPRAVCILESRIRRRSPQEASDALPRNSVCHHQELQSIVDCQCLASQVGRAQCTCLWRVREEKAATIREVDEAQQVWLPNPDQEGGRHHGEQLQPIQRKHRHQWFANAKERLQVASRVVETGIKGLKEGHCCRSASDRWGVLWPARLRTDPGNRQLSWWFCYSRLQPLDWAAVRPYHPVPDWDRGKRFLPPLQSSKLHPRSGETESEESEWCGIIEGQWASEERTLVGRPVTETTTASIQDRCDSNWGIALVSELRFLLECSPSPVQHEKGEVLSCRFRQGIPFSLAALHECAADCEMHGLQYRRRRDERAQ